MAPTVWMYVCEKIEVKWRDQSKLKWNIFVVEIGAQLDRTYYSIINLMIDAERQATFRGQYKQFTISLRMSAEDVLSIAVENTETLEKYSRSINREYISQQDIFFQANFEEVQDVYDYLKISFNEIVIEGDILLFNYRYGNNKVKRISIQLLRETMDPVEFAHLKADKMKEHFTALLLQKDIEITELKQKYEDMAQRHSAEIQLLRGQLRGELEAGKTKSRELAEKLSANTEKLEAEILQLRGELQQKQEEIVQRNSAQIQQLRGEFQQLRGDLKAEKIRGELETKKNRGELQAEKTKSRELAEKFSANTEKLDAEIQELRGNLKAEKTRGELETKKIKGEMEAEKTRGELETKKIRGEMEAEKIKSRQIAENQAQLLPLVPVVSDLKKMLDWYSKQVKIFQNIDHHPNNAHKAYYTLTNLTGTSARITRTGEDSKFYNFVSKCEILPHQKAKYSLTINKTTNNCIMVGFCTEKGLGNIRNYNHAESAYYRSQGAGFLYQGGSQKKIGVGALGGETVECVADLASCKLSWWKKGSQIAECAVPAGMRNKPIYISIILYYAGDEVDLCV